MGSTLVDTAIATGLLAAAAVPAVVGAVRDHRDNAALRSGKQGPDRRIGLLVTFDLAYGPREDRVRRANAGRTAAARRGPGAPDRTGILEE